MRRMARKWARLSARIQAMAAPNSPDLCNRLMAEFRGGSPEAAGKLVDFFYPELRRLASGRMLGERANHTWQPTVLVHELYLELTRVKALPRHSAADEDEKNAFFGLAAFLMKRLLVHHARPLPNRVTKVEIGEAFQLADSGEQCLCEIEDLLNRLGAIDTRLRAVVEMKAFEGLSQEEIAGRLHCSVRTVARHWDFAQHWLRQNLGRQQHLAADKTA
jgi:RNA polymerase sigma factor (TIGR02999 family)